MFRCDGTVDCDDGTDEINCSSTTPSPVCIWNGVEYPAGKRFENYF